jgi:hypothetical protein
MEQPNRQYVLEFKSEDKFTFEAKGIREAREYLMQKFDGLELIGSKLYELVLRDSFDNEIALY